MPAGPGCSAQPGAGCRGGGGQRDPLLSSARWAGHGDGQLQEVHHGAQHLLWGQVVDGVRGLLRGGTGTAVTPCLALSCLFLNRFSSSFCGLFMHFSWPSFWHLPGPLLSPFPLLFSGLFSPFSWTFWHSSALFLALFLLS